MTHVAPHQCASCGAPIFWALTSRDRLMPLNWTPREDGAFVIRERAELANDEDLAVFAIDLRTTAAPQSSERFVSHFASCPQAAEWRRNPEAMRKHI